MIQIMHEALEWTKNHCNETKKKYETLKGYDSFMDLVEAYVAGAQYIQNELAKLKQTLSENITKQAVELEPGLTVVQNEDVVRVYEEMCKQIDEIIKL